MYQIQGNIDCSKLSDFEKYIYARFAYRNGIEYITDAQYDELERRMRVEHPTSVYLHTTYDDDPVPIDILESVGYTDEDILYFTTQTRTDSNDIDPMLQDKLDEQVSKSCFPYIDFESAYKAMEAVAGKELYIGLKVDGIKTRNLFQMDSNVDPSLGHMKHVLSLTRARANGSPINITPNVSRVIPHTLTGEKLIGRDFLIVNGESYYDGECIDYVNSKYHIDLKTPRSAGLSFLRNSEYDPTDYANLMFWAFKVDYGETVSEGLDLAEELGFNVVPYILYVYKSKPFAAFVKEFTEIIDCMHKLADKEGIPTDGLVVQLNNKSDFDELVTETQYDGGMFALKIGAWAPGMYTSTVVDIDIRQQTEQCSVKVQIVPTKTQSGVTVSMINMYNLENLITSGVVVGSKIVFQYKNETTPLFVSCIGMDENIDDAIHRAYMASRKNSVDNLFLSSNRQIDDCE